MFRNSKIAFRLIFVSILILFVFHIFNDLDLNILYFVNVSGLEEEDEKESIYSNYIFDPSEFFEEDNVSQQNNNINNNKNKNNQTQQEISNDYIYDQTKTKKVQQQGSIINNNNNNNYKQNENENDKYVILVFDRGYKTTFTKAKPILDKYDFKATLFIACSRIDDSKGLTWDMLRQLQNEGYDIQSHGEEHTRLTEIKSYDEIYSIVREGKECLQEQGFNPTVIQAPYNKGGDDPKIVDTISKYFDFAFTGHSELMFLNCDGYENFGYDKENYKKITDCSPYFSDGTPKPTSKYAMKEWSHDRKKDNIYESKYEDKNKDPHGKKVRKAMLEKFIEILEMQTEFNKDREINAIPIVSYHRLDINKDFDTPLELFEQEMEYLYENGYNVITVSDLGYDETLERFYVKNTDKTGSEPSHLQNLEMEKR